MSEEMNLNHFLYIQDDIDTANIEISEKQSINYKENCAQLIKDIEGFEYVCLYYYYYYLLFLILYIFLLKHLQALH